MCICEVGIKNHIFQPTIQFLYFMAKKKNSKNKKSKEEVLKPKAETMPKPQGFPSYFTNVPLICAKLFLISMLLYVGTLKHGFTQDDAIVITENKFTKEGDIESLLKYDTFRGFFQKEGKDNLVSGGRYRPLTPIMFSLGWKMTQEPFLFHFMNVMWYGLTVVMLFLVMLRMLQAESSEPYAYFVAFCTALIFAIHPVHVEVVANVKGRDEIMTLFLSLAALYVSLRDHEKGFNIIFQILIAVLFFLALMAKEMAAVFLPIVAISYFVFHKLNIIQSLLKTLPFLAGFIVFMIIRQMVLGSASDTSAVSMEWMNNPFLKYEGGYLVPMTDSEKYGTIFSTLGKYLGLLVFPVTLTHDYYPNSIPMRTFSDSEASLPLLMYLVLIGVGIWGVLKRKHFAYGIAFFLISLLLVSNIIFPIGVNMAERFLFMPSVGFCFVVSILLYRLCEWMNDKKKITAYSQFQPAMIALSIIFLASCFKSYTRSLDWKDNFSLFEADWMKSENSAKIRNAMGGELTAQSQKPGVKGTDKEKEMLTDALDHLDVTTSIHPRYKGPYLIKGNAHLYLGNYDAAIQNYQIALQLDPNYVEAEGNLKIALDAKQQAAQQEGITNIEKEGIEASSRGDFAEAIRIFSGLIKDYPKEPKYHFFVGIAYANSGDYNAALAAFKEAENLDDGKDPANKRRVVGAIIDTYRKLGDSANAALYEAKL